MRRIPIVPALLCVVVCAAPVFAENRSATRTDRIGNDDFGAHVDTLGGARNDVLNTWAQMHGYVTVFGEDVQAFSFVSHCVSGSRPETYAGLVVAGSQVLSSLRTTRQVWDDGDILSLNTPSVPVLDLAGVITFSLSLGASAGYDYYLDLDPRSSRAFIGGHARGWAAGSITATISVFWGLGSGSVRATLRFFDQELAIAFWAVPTDLAGILWRHNYGVTLTVELIGTFLWYSYSDVIVNESSADSWVALLTL